MKHIFIVNPNAGKKEKKKLLQNIKEVFGECDYQIEITKGPKDAIQIARHFAQSGGDVCLYACGGDGTVNEVVNGMWEYDNACVAVIPIGTGNDFVKSWGPAYDKKDFLTLTNYLTPTLTMCDVMDVEGHMGINTASVGLDVVIADKVDKFKCWPFISDTIPYYFALLNSLFSTLAYPYTIVLDGVALPKCEYSFVVVCNGNYYGGGFCPCPDASLNDGLLDVCLIKKVTRRKIARLANAYKKGEHIKYTDLVQMRRVKQVDILHEGCISINVDGEVQIRNNPTVRIIEKKVRLCLPNKMQ